MSKTLVTNSAESRSSQVRITSAPGTIWISSPERLGDCEEATYRRFIERVLTVDAVRSVDVNRDSGDVVVRYDRRALRQGEAMTRISGALNRGADARVGAFDLDLIAGHVTRVERRRWGAGALTTIVSTGNDFFTACSRVLRRQATEEESKSVTRDPSESVVIEHGLAIHFVPRVTDLPTLELFDPDREQRTQLAPAQGELTHGSHEITVARGFKRILHLTAAGGCFVMSFVGLVTPGIPTVPFVLATSYFLVRSSPTLNERLRNSRLFGQMVRDWEAHGGLRRSTKRKVVWFTLAIAGGTLLFAEISLPLLLLVGTMGTLGTTLILKLPTVEDPADGNR